jgi:hypothetical protein
VVRTDKRPVPGNGLRSAEDDTHIRCTDILARRFSELGERQG